MSRNVKYKKELKLEIIAKYLKGESPTLLANEYHLPPSYSIEIINWARAYNTLGENIFDDNKTNRSYSKEFKLKIVQEYIDGKGSFKFLSLKYNIPSDRVVRNWVKRYNNGIEFKDYDPKRDVYTMKSRKTSFEERLEIVKYVLDNNNDYKGAADKYGVPYANVYNWIKKYHEHGQSGLNDFRGRPSSNNSKKELTVEEQQALEIDSLKAKISRLELHNELLKKKMKIEDQMEKNFQSFVKSLNTKQ